MSSQLNSAKQKLEQAERECEQGFRKLMAVKEHAKNIQKEDMEREVEYFNCEVRCWCDTVVLLSL
jgi:hypothetical protein